MEKPFSTPMSPIGSFFRCLRQGCLTGLLLVIPAGCSLNHPPDETVALEKRVARLEREVKELHSTRSSASYDPAESEKALAAQREALLKERRRLLQSFTTQHPAIKLLDQKIHDLSLRQP